MNRSEFIKELKEALKNQISESDIQENVRYYAGYIDEEVKKGRKEKEVIEELGDPWLIAKTIVTTPGNANTYQSARDFEDDVEAGNEVHHKIPHMHVFDFHSKWKILLLILAIIGILFLVISVVSGIITMLMPLFGPILVIVILLKIFSNRKR